jgi:transposase-like protein
MRILQKTTTERRRLVELYESRGTGVTRREFCRIHHIATSTLDYWRRVERRESAGRLVAVELEPAKPTNSGSMEFALSLTNGRRIETGWRFADNDLARLIRIAESA